MSKINYKIFEIETPEDYKLKLIHPDLMKPVFRCVLIGHSGSGKSQFINNVLFNNSWGYNKYFNEIYVFNGSLDDVDAMKQMQANFKMKNLSIQQKYNDEIVKDLFESIEKDNIKKKLHKSRVLFIFDDQICNNISGRCKLNALDELATRGRHANASYIVSSQKYKSLNNNIRCLNATNLIVFSGTASSDLEAIAEEHNSIFSKDEMMDIFRKYLDKKYSFVIIDNVRRKLIDSDFEQIILEKK